MTCQQDMSSTCLTCRQDMSKTSLDSWGSNDMRCLVFTTCCDMSSALKSHSRFALSQWIILQQNTSCVCYLQASAHKLIQQKKWISLKRRSHTVCCHIAMMWHCMFSKMHCSTMIHHGLDLCAKQQKWEDSAVWIRGTHQKFHESQARWTTDN